MIEILEKFHNMGYTHNDMKPQNIMTKMPSAGVAGASSKENSANQLFLIDFGLTTSQSDHSKYKFKGTPYFASISAL
jgi:serine/threonine protein kinase